MLISHIKRREYSGLFLSSKGPNIINLSAKEEYTNLHVCLFLIGMLPSDELLEISLEYVMFGSLPWSLIILYMSTILGLLTKEEATLPQY